MKCFIPFDERILDGMGDQTAPSTLVPYEYDYCCWRVFREESGTENQVQAPGRDVLQTDWTNHGSET
ncbi:MAG: hypothetical protein OXG08_10500 [Gammaproteobacteria bacterium]|nr:hypothetical protein [Gammaproteobacteria bacterium]